MFVIAYGCPSDSHASYLHYYGFGSEDTDRQMITIVHVTHTAFLTSSIPIVWVI